MSKTRKNITLSSVMPKNYDSAKIRRRYGAKALNANGTRLTYDYQLFERAQQAWNNKENVRKVAERTENYTFDDDQWGDIITVDGEEMTEREYIRRQGNVPLSDNIMISIFSTITGLYDKQGSEPSAIARDNVNLWLSDMMSATLQTNWTNNKVPRTLSVAWRTFLLSGIACVRTSWEMQDDGIPDVDTRLVDPYKLFWEGGSDPKYEDITLIGQLCDISQEELYNKFAKPEYGITRQDLNEIYAINDGTQERSSSPVRRGNASALSGASWSSGASWPSGAFDPSPAPQEQQNDQNRLINLSFTHPNTPHCYRVIEVWTKESKTRWQCWDPIATKQEDAYYKIENNKADVQAIEKINNERRKQFREAGMPIEECPVIKMEPIEDVYWYFTFMAHDGTVLCSGETPYDHKRHPFTLLLYPNVHGKVYPYMSFTIPQQRNLNRLNIMNDLAIRSTTKGLTIYPEDIIPDDMTPEEFDDKLTSYRGVVRYKINRLNANARPDIITSNAANLGIPELMQMKINLMQQVANVSGALQGKTPSAGTAASRYQMESENSTTSLFTVINDFSEFMERIGMNVCELIKQKYEDGRLVFSQKGNANMLEYRRWEARDMKFLISIKETAATAAYQQRRQEKLDLLLERQVVDGLTYLDNSSDPLDKQLAQDIRMSMQNGTFTQQQFQVPGADQQAVQQAQQMMGFQQ